MLEKLKGIFGHATRWATKFETWIAIGSFAMSTGFFTWLGNGLTALSALGWSAIILFGVASTCILMVCAAAFLAAWRYFRPLPGAQQKKSAAPSPQPAQTNHQIGSEILHLLNFSVDQSTITMLDYLINQAPKDLHDDILKIEGSPIASLEERREYINSIARHLGPGTHRYGSFVNLMTNAESEAEHHLENIPQSDRPEIDPLVLRKHAIANRQCYRAINFLKNQKREKEEQIRRQRSKLIELWEQRNNATGC